MKSSKKILVLLGCFILGSSLAMAAKTVQFSNIIVFGDSLSDIGNVPENVNIYHDAAKPAILTNLETNFYVPIANPVNPAGYTVPFIHYQLPNFVLRNPAYLPAQPEIAGVTRSNRSMVWNEFFLADAYQAGITKSQNLIPWTSLETAEPSIPSSTLYSVNYAWVGALSDQGCFNKIWQPQANCTAPAILAAWQNYITNRTDANYGKILIPGLLSQVQLFSQDVQANKIKVDTNTVYTIWIGGNDLTNAFNQIEHSPTKEKITAFKKIIFTTTWNVFKTLKLLITNQQIQAKHIYVFNIFDPSLLPRVHQWNKVLQYLGKGFVDIYNSGLQLDVAMMNALYPNVSIHIVPIHTWSMQMAKAQGIYQGLGFDKHVGAACELSTPSSGSYLTPQTSLDNCQGYMFWNSIHPAFPLEQIMGYKLLQEVTNTFTTTATNTATIKANQIATEQQQKVLLKQSIDQKIKQL